MARTSKIVVDIQERGFFAMTVGEVFDTVKAAPDIERWRVSDEVMSIYSGNDWDVVRQSLDEFIMSNSQFNDGE